MNTISTKYKGKNISLSRNTPDGKIIATNDDGTILNDNEFNKLWKALGFLIKLLIKLFL